VNDKKKPKLNITTKNLSCKQNHLYGFQQCQKINFIRSDNKGIIVTTNKVAATLDLNIVEKCLKNLNDIDSSDVMSPRLPQSKSYLKILDILYFVEDTNLLLTYDIIEKVIKTTHIFNNVVLASHPCVIKMFPKSNMAVV